ncbi:MAG: Gx transporter family protein [Clostridia bacterium]|nr:Gx transporter family protein [Clostridia bacterium]
MHKKTKAVASLGVFTALALLLSYVEFLLPPLFVAVPGIKIGLPNVIIILALYMVGLRSAIAISLLRVILSSILFGNAMVFAYSIAGAILSITVMAILKKTDILSPVGVSVAGGVAHNMGQTIVAVILLDTPQIAYYMIVLTLTGIASGAFVGLLGGFLMKRIPKNKL